jgi:hypothetical protein
MTTPAAPTPDPTPEPEQGGLLGRLRSWFEKDIEPRLIAVEADLANVKGLGPQVSELASIVEKIAASADPAAAPEIAALAAGASAVAAKIGQIVAGLESSGAL